MIVISDTTPLTYLLQIEHVFLLQRLYGNIIIPVAVQDELLRFAPTKNAAQALFQADWVSIQKPDLLIGLSATADIGMGEWEALSLAVERKADLVLVDRKVGDCTGRSPSHQNNWLVGNADRSKSARSHSRPKAFA